jgi:hypothetical protein
MLAMPPPGTALPCASRIAAATWMSTVAPLRTTTRSTSKSMSNVNGPPPFTTSGLTTLLFDVAIAMSFVSVFDAGSNASASALPDTRSKRGAVDDALVRRSTASRSPAPL